MPLGHSPLEPEPLRRVHRQRDLGRARAVRAHSDSEVKWSTADGGLELAEITVAQSQILSASFHVVLESKTTDFRGE